MSLLGKVVIEYAPRGETRVSLRCVPTLPGPAAVKPVNCLKAYLSVVAISRNGNQGRHTDMFRIQSGFGHKADPTEFTTHAKRMVEDAAALVEQQCGLDVIFTTLTLPGQRPQTKRVLADWSSWIVAKIKDWIQYHAPSSLTIGVWERQKAGALHLHIATGCRDIVEREIIEHGLIDYWYHLMAVLTRKTRVNMFLNASGDDYTHKKFLLVNECVRVYKSVSKYLSKYCSKASSKNFGAKYGGTSLGLYFPTRWWFIDAKLRRQVRAARRKIESEVWQLEVAKNIYETVAGEVAVLSAKQFPYDNPVFTGDRHLVLLHNDEHDKAFAQFIGSQNILNFRLKTVAATTDSTGGNGTKRSVAGSKQLSSVDDSSLDIFQHFMQTQDPYVYKEKPEKMAYATVPDCRNDQETTIRHRELCVDFWRDWGD